MTAFFQLDPPKFDGDSNKWYIQTSAMIGGLWYCLLTDSSGTIDAPSFETDDNTFLFDSEIDAHVAANYYYTQNNRTYPYLNEWGAAMTFGGQIVPRTIESQVMEFE